MTLTVGVVAAQPLFLISVSGCSTYRMSAWQGSCHGATNFTIVARRIGAFILVALALAAIGVSSGIAQSAFTTRPDVAPPAGAPAASRVGCPKVVLYFSRGSGQKAAGDINDPRGLERPGRQLYDVLVRRYGPAAVGSMSNGYPAVDIGFYDRGIRSARAAGIIGRVRSVVGVLADRGKTGLRTYEASVVDGIRSAFRNITDLVRLCPKSELVVGGYSQGAQVTRGALVRLGPAERDRVAAVVLFGDPLFKHDEPNVTVVADERIALPPDPKRRGIGRVLPVGGANPVADDYARRVFSWCHGRDLVCQGLGGFKAHGTYADETESAGARIAARLRARGAVPASAPVDSGPAGTYHVAGACAPGPCTLATWSGPGTTRFKRVDVVSEHQQLDIACQTIGESVTGANRRSSAIWDRLTDGSFISDFYVDTPNINEFSPPLPRCSEP